MGLSHNILDLGLSDYNDTWKLQKKLQSKRILGEIEDHLLLVEHPPVFTLGKMLQNSTLLMIQMVCQLFKLIEVVILHFMALDSLLVIRY